MDGSPRAAAVSWGDNVSPARTFRVPLCAAAGTADLWLTYAGGIYLADPGCVTLQIRIGAQSEDLLVGVGAPCPGQQEPAAPSDT